MIDSSTIGGAIGAAALGAVAWAGKAVIVYVRSRARVVEAQQKTLTDRDLIDRERLSTRERWIYDWQQAQIDRLQKHCEERDMTTERLRDERDTWKQKAWEEEYQKKQEEQTKEALKGSVELLREHSAGFERRVHVLEARIGERDDEIRRLRARLHEHEIRDSGEIDRRQLGPGDEDQG